MYAAAAKLLHSCPTLRPHGLQPTRLLHPWDSPGKNTGVGCHFLLQFMKVESESEVVQSCLTLSDPMDCSLPGSSIHGIFRATVLEWGAIAFSLPMYKYPQIFKPSCLLGVCVLHHFSEFPSKLALCVDFSFPCMCEFPTPLTAS